MIEDVINQPVDGHFAEILYENLTSEPPNNYRRLFILTAWTTYSGLYQLTQAFRKFRLNGGEIFAVTGISLGGTSVEGLKLLYELSDKLCIFHDKRTLFHLKLYIFQNESTAKVIVGSNNLTHGGLFSNYEIARIITIDLSNDTEAKLFSKFKRVFDFYSTPSKVCRVFDDSLLSSLVRSKLVTSERNKAFLRTYSDARQDSEENDLFGSFSYTISPLFLNNKGVKNYKVEKIELQDLTSLKFYMNLSKLQGNIPGEARIPTTARDQANDFWGWPRQYTRTSRNQGTQVRYYVEWKTKWKIVNESTGKSSIDDVRLYLLEANKDFRFYSAVLVSFGADSLDIIEISRPQRNEGFTFLCKLAKKGTAIHNQWSEYLSQSIKNSVRRFGYVY